MPLHKVPDSRTGKGVFIQYVPYSGPPIRSGQGSESDREAGQNLVSESAHEDEENEQRKGRQQGTITWTASRETTRSQAYTWTGCTRTRRLHSLYIYHFVGFFLYSPQSGETAECYMHNCVRHIKQMGTITFYVYKGILYEKL